MTSVSRKPLKGVRVLDFSTLLPGPMATLILAEAGAEVIKIERPKTGEDMRPSPPMVSTDMGVNFALLNRGKESVEVDLKDPNRINDIKEKIRNIDVLVEQFRPGVMDRLGLGYEALKEINPALIYCSISGYGQTGPKAQIAAHDLNYMSETGALALGAGNNGSPVVPPVLVADIGGGTFPAVVSILLALREAEQTGEGAYLDIAMADNLFAWSFWAYGAHQVSGTEIKPGGELLTGGSPRYQIYECSDGRYLGCAPLEEKFWQNFCDVIGLQKELRDDSRDPGAIIGAVSALIRQKSSAEWVSAFEGLDACVALVKSHGEAAADPHFLERGLFSGAMHMEKASFSPLPVPIAPIYRDPEGAGLPPALGSSELGQADDGSD